MDAKPGRLLFPTRPITGLPTATACPVCHGADALCMACEGRGSILEEAQR